MLLRHKYVFYIELDFHLVCLRISKDKTVIIWTKDSLTAPWVKTTLDPSSASTSAAPASTGKFPDVVWRVSWSLAGNILAVSCGDGKVTLWKENLRGVWECVSDMTS